MKVLDRYILATILRAAAVVAVAVVGLSLVSTFVGDADNMDKGSYGLIDLTIYSFLKMPDHVHTVLPVIALLGALLGLGGLAAGSELVVIRSAGVSIARLAGSVALAGLVFAAVAVVLGEWAGPVASRSAETFRDAARYGEAMQSVEGGWWLRAAGDTVRIDGSLSEDVMVGVRIYRRGDQGRLRSVLRAGAARFQNGHWVLQDVAVTRFGPKGTVAEQVERMAWNVDIEPAFLRLTVIEPQELASLGLFRYIEYLERNGVAADPYRLALWRNLVTPFTALVLTVFALPFTFGALRSAGAGQRLFLGGLAGLIFFMLNEIAASSGQVYGLPAWLAASWPTGLLAVITFFWLRRLR